MVRAPLTPPPPSAPSFAYYRPIEASGMRQSPPMNPWNPYFRNYGRLYPYNVPLNQYESAPPQNYVVMRESSSQQPTNYATRAPCEFLAADRVRIGVQPRVHLVHTASPPLPPPVAPQPLSQHFNNPLPMGESMRRTLARPRSNHSRSFHHYRHGVQDTEISSGYSSLPVIEISSEEEENNGDAMPCIRASPFLRRHSEHTRPLCNRNTSNNVIRNIRSPAQRLPIEPKSNQHTSHLRTTSSEDNLSSSGSQHHANESFALSSNNRVKRPHRFSSHSPSKVFRRSHGCRRSDSNYTPENVSPYSNEASESGRNRPRVCLNESNINVEPGPSTSQSISNRNSNNDIYHRHHDHHHQQQHNDTHNGNNNHNNSDGSNNDQIEQKEQKFKIRIKREFKIEPNDKSENNENADSESVVIDTKAHLQPLIANIKEE